MATCSDRRFTENENRKMVPKVKLICFNAPIIICDVYSISTYSLVDNFDCYKITEIDNSVHKQSVQGRPQNLLMHIGLLTAHWCQTLEENLNFYIPFWGNGPPRYLTKVLRWKVSEAEMPLTLRRKLGVTHVHNF